MKIRLHLFAALVAATALSSSALADTIYFVGNRDAVDGTFVVTETIRRIEWKRDGKGEGTASPWEVERIDILRERKDAASNKWEADLNEAIRKGMVGANWEKTGGALKAAIAADIPANYIALPPKAQRLRGRAVLLRGIQVNAPVADPPTNELPAGLTEEFEAYKTANKEYAEAIARIQGASLNRKIAAGDYAGLDIGTLHATAIDVLATMGHATARAGNAKDAWTKYFQQAADLATQLRQATNQTGFLTSYALPILEAAAKALETAKTPEWKTAEEIHEKIRQLALQLGDQTRASRASLDGARCKLETGDTSGARSVYSRAVGEFEGDGTPARGPAKRGWLSPEKAAAYAAAYNGLGEVAVREKNWFEALKAFASSAAYFSTDREARAVAVLGAGLALTKLGAEKKDVAYYANAAESYLNELTRVLNDTAAAARTTELSAAIAALRAPAPK